MPGQTLQLRDIKPIVAVPDHSLWLFAALVTGILVLLGILIFRLLRRKRGRIDRRRAEALRRLDALDFGDTKSAGIYSLVFNIALVDGNFLFHQLR